MIHRWYLVRHNRDSELVLQEFGLLRQRATCFFHVRIPTTVFVIHGLYATEI